jgi:hypothetical protein
VPCARAIERYLAEGVQPYDVGELRGFPRPPASPTCAENEQTDILQWWQATSRRFPRLSVMTADFCAAPATIYQRPIRRGFSTASDFITEKRNRMTPETAEARMCARYWLKLPRQLGRGQAIGTADAGPAGGARSARTRALRGGWWH